MIDWLKIVKNYNGDDAYTLDSAKDFEVVELFQNGKLILNFDKNKFILNFAVMSFCSSDMDGENILLSPVFNGSGCLGNLRECRHTWWGDEDGYVYYPDGRLIKDAFDKLSKYFDEMS